MKPETQQWLDKVIPILAHLREGGQVRYKDDGKLYGNTGVHYFCLLTRPDLYPIHVEPRVVYIPYYGNPGGCSMPSYSTEAEAGKHVGLTCIRVVRFVEDLNWKPHDATQQAGPTPTPNQT